MEQQIGKAQPDKQAGPFCVLKIVNYRKYGEFPSFPRSRTGWRLKNAAEFYSE
jgi:hypothetical protein